MQIQDLHNHKIFSGKSSISILAAGIVYLSPLLFGVSKAHAESETIFSPAFLEKKNGAGTDVDLSIFSQGGQAPGIYNVDVYINDNYVDNMNIDFYITNVNNKKKLMPCLSQSQINSLGIDVEWVASPFKKNSIAVTSECNIFSTIKDASLKFNFNEHRLRLSIPQVNLKNNGQGYISPERWDNGITALFMNYSADANNVYGKHHNNDGNSQYLNLRPGLNIGAWRIRNYSTYANGSNKNGKWDTVYTYAQRSIIPLRSQLTVGESTTPSDVFESTPFRGIQLASDDDMLPDSLKGYAPVVRGIARTNAQVIIKQNGYVIYQRAVAPGAFVIDDMYPTGGSGDLYVTVKESNGVDQYLVVPFSSLPVLQREGRFKYNLTTGQYRPSDRDVENTPLTQATGIYGLKNGTTLYGGMQAASKYQSLAFGLGQNLGDYGAVSLDAVQAWSRPKSKNKQNGRSFRVKYSKNIVDTGTNFSIAGYKYSTDGYYDMQDVLDTYNNHYYGSYERLRNRTEVTMNQKISDDLGVISLSLANENYWNQERRMTSLSLSYNNSWDYVSYDLGWSYNKNSSHFDNSNSHKSRYYDEDNIFSFNISIPLDKLLGNSWVTYGLESSNGSVSNRVGLNGTALADNNLSWGIQESYNNKDKNSGNINADYRGTYGEFTGSYGYDQESRQINYGIQGGVLLHENGVTLSQATGDTAVLVRAPGANNVSVENQTGVSTDYRGYTIVPYVMPFRQAEITLDTETLGDNVELEKNSKTVVPTRGAISVADFSTNIGKRALISIRDAKKHIIPFGAVAAVTNKENSSSIVGDNGEVFLTGLDNSGSIRIQWGRNKEKKCTVKYSLSNVIPHNGIYVLDATCE